MAIIGLECVKCCAELGQHLLLIT